LSTIAELNVKIGADIKDFDKKMAGMGKRMDKLGKDFGKAGKNITKKVGVPIVALGTAMVGAGIKIGNTADEILDLSDQTGLSTDRLQEYRAVTSDAGIETDAMARATVQLRKRMGQTDGESDKFAESMKTLGVEIKDADGSFRDMDDVMAEATRSLQNVEDETQRSALAYNLFGREGEKIAPVLGMNSEQMQEVTDRANELGLVMGKDSLESADDFRKSMELLQIRFMGLFNELASELIPLLEEHFVPLIEEHIIPAIQEFVGWIIKIIEWFTELDPKWQDMILLGLAFLVALGPLLIVIGKLISFGATLTTIFTKIAGVFGIVKKAVLFLLTPLGLKIGAILLLIGLGVLLWKNWETVSEKGKKIFSELKDFFAEVIDGITGFFSGMAEKIDGIFKGVGESIKSAINGIAGVINRMIRAVNRIRIKVPSVNIPLVGQVGGFSIGMPNIPQIPRLADGGIIDSPTLAMIGEDARTRPEIVTPEKLLRQIMREETEGVKIEIGEMVVRDDSDIERIAQKLFRLQQTNLRARGVIT